MKKAVFILSIILLIPGIAISAPFLVTDPVDSAECGAADQPTCPATATIYEDGLQVASEIALEPDMSIRFDVGGRPPGNHRYTAIYHDQYGGVSLASNPTQLGPLSPQNMRLVP